MGVPLADSAGVTSTSVLGLDGAAVAQFRLLGVWPSGNYKWVKVCGIVPSLGAGSTVTVTLTDGGGNFGGSDLATDNGPTITVATGTATFTIKKANFNVIDSAVVSGTTVVTSSSSATRGLILTGPDPLASFPANVTCGTCSTVYSSANDSGSTASIEENGPVMTVIKAIGNHIDASGHPYMHFTVRMTFYKNQNSVKVTTILRNADYNTSATPSPDAAGNTFNTAYKGLQSYELRISPNIIGKLNYTIATDNMPQAGTLNQAGGTDSAYIYQGQTNFMINHENGDPSCPYQSACANTYTSDAGYTVYKNTAQIASGDASSIVGGWADISDSGGVGIEIGVYQMAAYWPKSLEFDRGGTDVRIGIWPRQNSQPIYQAWPAWSIHDLFLNFHPSAPASLSNEFLKFQHYLVARPSVGYVNATNVFPYPIVDPVVEDNYYKDVAAKASPAVTLSSLCWNGNTPCTPDRDVGDQVLEGSAMNVTVTRSYGWGGAGPLNQEEFRWADLQKFLQRGFTGRWLNSAHFYRFQSEKAWPHADGISPTDSTPNHFAWRERPHAGGSGAELDGEGHPSVACGQNSKCGLLANSSKSFVSWVTLDLLHTHWYGQPTYYFMTGDETIRDAMVSMKDFYMNMDTYQAAAFNSFVIPRALGIELLGASRFSDYLASLGDPDSAVVLNQPVNVFNTRLKPDVCVSGYPSGCTLPPLNAAASPSDPVGISRVRGMQLGGRGQGWCPHATGPNNFRVQEAFQTSILIEGLLSLRKTMGPTWSDFGLAQDLAYGLSQWSLLESYNDDGTNNWQGALNAHGYSLYNGFRYVVWADFANVCPAGTVEKVGTMDQMGSHVYDHYSEATTGQGVWFNFYAQYLTKGTTDWERQMRTQMIQVGYHRSAWPADFGSYQLGILIDAIKNPTNVVLQDIPYAIQDNGGGSYTLTWTVPSGVQSYRIKWSPKIIAPFTGLLNFDNLYSNTFGLSPDQYATWFGANGVSEPEPATPGQPQSFTLNTGTAGLKTQNFSVKAYVAGGGTGGPGAAAILALVSGNGQTGAVSQQLANPFTVEVTDADGNPVPGISVTFTVIGGGGTLTATKVTTNSVGLASSTLTLGPSSGTNTVVAASATLAGSPVTITATGTTSAAGPAANLVLVSGNTQTGTVGQQLASPFTVKVADATGNPVSGINVNFAVTAGNGHLVATMVATNSAGLASTTLTLGTSAGTNTVVATSGTLTGSPITFTATAVATGKASVSWSQLPSIVGRPGTNGWFTLPYDPVSQQTIIYGVPAGSVSIYSSDIFFYNSSNDTFTHLGGTGSMIDACHDDIPTQPGDRHPYGQMAIDSKRNVLWLYGGVCNGAVRKDMYYLTLNPNPLNDLWHQVTPAHFPASIIASALVYDPDDDVLFAFGYDLGANVNDNWIYCRTAENSPPGIPTSKQRTAGCTSADDWNLISVANSIQPVASMYTGIFYDAVTKKVLLYGGQTSGGVKQNQTWAYDVPTKTWAQKALSTTSPPITQDPVPEPALAYNTATNKLMYHLTVGPGAPADYQYDPVADTWTKLASTGGATLQQTLAYDSRNNVLVGWKQGYGYELWKGTLTGSGGTGSKSCDLNGDGVINVQDVQLAVNQVLGIIPCTSADLVGNGACTVVDVERVILASFGGTCRIGP